MKLVDRIVWRELFGPLVSSVLMFLMLLFTSAYLSKLTDLMVQGAPLSVVAKVGLPPNAEPGLVAEVRRRCEEELLRYLNPCVGGPDNGHCDIIPVK